MNLDQEMKNSLQIIQDDFSFCDLGDGIAISERPNLSKGVTSPDQLIT